MANNEIRYSNNRTPQQRIPARRKVVDFSFDKRLSIGEWIYKSMVSIVVVLVALLGLAIAFAFAKISVGTESFPIEQRYEVDITGDNPIDEEQQPEEKKEKKEQTKVEDDLFKQHIKNIQSNEAALNQGGSENSIFDEQTQEMLSHVNGLQSGNNYSTNNGEDLTTQYSSTSGKQGDGSGGEGGGSGSGKGKGKGNNFKGAVTVEYKFENPTRVARGQLYIPAYKAEHSGRVVIEADINRNGEVIRATIKSSSGVKALDNEALAAAKHKLTIFNIDSSAPKLHRGTITYIFIAQ